MAGTESQPEQDLAKELAARSGGGRGVGKLTLVLVGLVLVVGGFAGGVVFNKATASAGTGNGAGGQQGQFGPGRFGPGQQGTGDPTPGPNGPGNFGGQNGGFVSGTITAVSGDTVTVKQADGTTKQVKTSSSTTVTLSQKGTLDELKSGDTVLVRGQEGDDGTVTAQAIAEGETGFGRDAQRQNN
jgi:hypothetical protein